MQTVGSYFDTLDSILALIAPHAGGTIPDENSEEYAQWVQAIQMKYEEASRRGFWRRLLKKGELELTADDEEVYLPVDFQRPNGLYILYVDEVDIADADREADDQSIFVEMDNNIFLADGTTDNTMFGRWRITFDTAIETTQDAPIWYFATPPKPTDGTDKLLLPGDMLAFGALTEIFRSTNLEGSQDDARIEYENRLNNYLALEMIPGRHELLTFATNPRRLDRSVKARARYAIRTDRVSRSY